MFSPEGYRALTGTAGVVRRADRGVLTVTGADRLPWLQGLLTNDVAALAPGSVADAAYLTPQGRMVSDMRVVHLTDRTLLDVPAPLAAALRERLDGLLFAEDAQIADDSAALAVIEIHGPSAAQVAAAAADVAIVRDDAYGVPGYCAFVPMTDADAVVARLVARGAVETTLETLDAVRIEAGRPKFLVDMDEHTIPLEAGLEHRAISFTKGCYVGQEVIVRIMHRGGGRVAKKLVGFRLDIEGAAAAGDAVVADGRDVGRVTSVTRSPALDAPIALGYVQRDLATPGTTLEIRTQSGNVATQIVGLPFVPRSSGENLPARPTP